jgi:hypothetical protein
MLEVLNAPLPVGATPFPDRDVSEPQMERLFRLSLAEIRPDVVHIQELAGLPSSVIDLSHDAGVPVVFTLQDYFALCPTFRLFDADGQICRRLDPGAMCQVCCASGETIPLVAMTANHDLRRLVRRLPAVRRAARAALGGARRLRPVRAPVERTPDAMPSLPASAEAYQRRRDTNRARLSRVDALLGTSMRVTDIQRELGVAPDRLRTLHLTVKHLEDLAVRRIDAPPRPVHFATLNGASGIHKGAAVLEAALHRLHELGFRDGYAISIFGAVDHHVRQALERHGSVRIGGPYTTADLDALLADVDVGIVPSIWEEPYAHVGLELLAKGIPIISNARGGLPDYTRRGVSGWLNQSATGEELADIMVDVCRRPEQVVELHRSIVARRSELVKPFPTHLDELEGIYRAVIPEGRRAP